MRDDIHRDRLQLVFHVTHGEGDELLIDVDVRGTVDEPGPGAFGVFREPLDKRLRTLHARKDELEVGEERRLHVRKIILPGYVFQGVGFGDGAIDDGVFFGGKSAEHDAEEPDEVDDVRTQDICGGLILARLRQVERIDAVI